MDKSDLWLRTRLVKVLWSRGGLLASARRTRSKLRNTHTDAAGTAAVAKVLCSVRRPQLCVCQVVSPWQVTYLSGRKVTFRPAIFLSHQVYRYHTQPHTHKNRSAHTYTHTFITRHWTREVRKSGTSRVSLRHAGTVRHSLGGRCTELEEI